MEISEFYSTVDALHSEARRRKLYFQASEDEVLNGRGLKLHGRELVTFGSCSYLGLEFHPKLQQGVIDAVQKYGTQFAYSRAYIASPTYLEAEELLGEIFGGHAMISLTTSLGHQTVLPRLATERDAIILDNQAHHSIQKAATLAQAGGAKVEIVRHFELDEKAIDTVKRLSRKHRTVFFAIDGVYSMYGDCAPVKLVQEMLDVAPNLRVFVDDAHGMSWAGKNGRGWFLDNFPLSDRVVFGTSLNKAYSAAGGCFVFTDEKECEMVRMSGGPYAFSGPPQPPMLGAILASAKLHLTGEIYELQRTYRERVDLMNELMQEYDLPLLSRNESPIFFLRMGKAEAAYTLAQRMYEEGFYVNTSTYPMVPLKRAGMRITVTALHKPEELRALCEALAHHIPSVLEEHDVAREELDELFERALPSESWGGIELRSARSERSEPVRIRPDSGIRVKRLDSISRIAKDEWNEWMTGKGASSWDALGMAEEVFQGHSEKEFNWEWQYLVASDKDGRVVGATYCCRALTKDDMWMRPEVSLMAEERRRDDPYFLSSDTLMIGSPLTEGSTIYLAEDAEADLVLDVLVEEVEKIAEEWAVEKIILRDFAADDEAIEGWMHRRDWIKIPVLDSYRIPNVGATEAEMFETKAAGSRQAHRVRKYFRELAENSEKFIPRVYGVHGAEMPDEWVPHLHQLYRNVASRAFRIRDFGFPAALISGFLSSPAWEIVALHDAADPNGPPAAWFAAHRFGEEYSPYLGGIDYQFVEGEYGVYRQNLLQTTRRAREVGARIVNLGYDAEREKQRLGGIPQPRCVYARNQQHDYGEQMLELVTELGLANSDVELVN